MNFDANPAEPTFHEWLAWAFDHPVTDPQWYWEDDSNAEEFESRMSPATKVRYLTELFDNAPVHLRPYSPEMVEQGLWFLIHSICSEHTIALDDPSVTDDARQKYFDATLALFRDYFAKECENTFDIDSAPPPMGVCFMWWDLMYYKWWYEEPWSTACLTILEQTIRIQHAACQSAALHGLGHIAVVSSSAKKRARRIILDFLHRNPVLDEEVRRYAEAAMDGSVA